LGEPTAEVFDLVPKLGDGGVLGRNLGTVGPLGRAAVLGELHLVGDAGGLQRLALQGPRPTDRPTSLIERAAGSGKIVCRTAGPRFVIRYGLVTGHKANVRLGQYASGVAFWLAFSRCWMRRHSRRLLLDSRVSLGETRELSWSASWCASYIC